MLVARANNLSSVLGLMECKERKGLWLGKAKLQVLALNLGFPFMLVSRLQAGRRDGQGSGIGSSALLVL